MSLHAVAPRRGERFLYVEKSHMGVPQSENTWAWGTEQKVATDENGNPEEIAVSVCPCGV